MLGLVGNCSYNALIEGGSVEWLCWPRPDSSFVFGPLLDRQKGGAFSVEGVGSDLVQAQYLENTNILRTVFTSADGTFELIDFAPRFLQHDRPYKPSMLVRIVRPVDGNPRIRVRCRPVYDYGERTASSWRASNHIEYTGLPAPVRLTTNVPLSHVEDERPFLLDRDHHLVLTWGQPLEVGLEETCERFLERTAAYWRTWVKRTRVPRDWQQQVIRSALVLKLHQYEDTGALLAATTTSLPEHPGSGRTWDYRYCWLRDAYFTLNAMERLGHPDEMEHFLVYLRNLAAEKRGELGPVYTITGDDEAPERELDWLDGFRGEKPVRVGNQAFEHVQNDVYGEMILAISRLLLDARFAQTLPAQKAIELVRTLLGQIEARMEEPDAGLWEIRGAQRLHAFTLLMHWAGARRAAEIGEELGVRDLVKRGRAAEAAARRLLDERCWDPERGALTQVAGEPQLDAAMLLALHFGFWAPGDPRARSHVDATRDALKVPGKLELLRRYTVPDDFGVPEAAFTVCSFWLVEALHAVGEEDEACRLFGELLRLDNGLGLYSEDILPRTGEQSGNLPQTYSHVGLINAAFRLSRSWD